MTVSALVAGRVEAMAMTAAVNASDVANMAQPNSLNIDTQGGEVGIASIRMLDIASCRPNNACGTMNTKTVDVRVVTLARTSRWRCAVRRLTQPVSTRCRTGSPAAPPAARR